MSLWAEAAFGSGLQAELARTPACWGEPGPGKIPQSLCLGLEGDPRGPHR